MALDKEIARFSKNAGETVIVKQTKYKGHQLIDMRIYFKSDSGIGTEELRPTKKGLCVRAELVGDLIEALQKAEREVFGLL